MQVFLLSDEAARAEFLRAPWAYCEQPVPAKLPPSPIELLVSKLPVRGYLEQSMGQVCVCVHARRACCAWCA